MEELFTQQQICEALQSNPQIQKVCFAPAVDSTNYWAKREATGMPDGTIFLTEEQSAGHGRFGRVWTSQAGRAIYASLLLRPNILPTTAPMLTLVMGLSVAQGISALTGLDCRIKWPNDIVIAGKNLRDFNRDVDKR